MSTKRRIEQLERMYSGADPGWCDCGDMQTAGVHWSPWVVERTPAGDGVQYRHESTNEVVSDPPDPTPLICPRCHKRVRAIVMQWKDGSL